MIAAIVRAQLLSMRSFRLGSSRRGAAVSIITGLVWYGFWTLISVAAFEYTSGGDEPFAIRLRLPLGFLLVMMYWQLAAMISASLRASLDLNKVLVLVLVLTTAAPRVLLMSNVRMHNAERWFSATENPVWPWTAASHLATGPNEIFALITMFAWSVLALAFGRWQFSRSLRFDAQ